MFSVYRSTQLSVMHPEKKRVLASKTRDNYFPNATLSSDLLTFPREE